MRGTTYGCVRVTISHVYIHTAWYVQRMVQSPAHLSLQLFTKHALMHDYAAIRMNMQHNTDTMDKPLIAHHWHSDMYIHAQWEQDGIPL